MGLHVFPILTPPPPTSLPRQFLSGQTGTGYVAWEMYLACPNRNLTDALWLFFFFLYFPLLLEAFLEVQSPGKSCDLFSKPVVSGCYVSYILLFKMPFVYGKLGHMSNSTSYILDLLGCFLMVLINLCSFACFSLTLIARSWLNSELKKKKKESEGEGQKSLLGILGEEGDRRRGSIRTQLHDQNHQLQLK